MPFLFMPFFDSPSGFVSLDTNFQSIEMVPPCRQHNPQRLNRKRLTNPPVVGIAQEQGVSLEAAPAQPFISPARECCKADKNQPSPAGTTPAQQLSGSPCAELRNVAKLLVASMGICPKSIIGVGSQW